MIAADLADGCRAAPDREPDMRVVGLEKVRCDRMAELMSSDGDLVAFRVLDRYREAGLDVAHRLANVLPVEGFARILERVKERQRKHLLDVRR